MPFLTQASKPPPSQLTNTNKTYKLVSQLSPWRKTFAFDSNEYGAKTFGSVYAVVSSETLTKELLSRDLHAYEIVQVDKPVRLFFDIDFETQTPPADGSSSSNGSSPGGERDRDETKLQYRPDRAEQVVHEIMSLLQEFIGEEDKNSGSMLDNAFMSRCVRPHNPNKHSFHLTFPGIVFHQIDDDLKRFVFAFAKWCTAVKERYDLAYKRPCKNGKIVFGRFAADLMVYTKNRCLRGVNQSKLGGKGCKLEPVMGNPNDWFAQPPEFFLANRPSPVTIDEDRLDRILLQNGFDPSTATFGPQIEAFFSTCFSPKQQQKKRILNALPHQKLPRIDHDPRLSDDCQHHEEFKRAVCAEELGPHVKEGMSARQQFELQLARENKSRQGQPQQYKKPQQYRRRQLLPQEKLPCLYETGDISIAHDRDFLHFIPADLLKTANFEALFLPTLVSLAASVSKEELLDWCSSSEKSRQKMGHTIQGAFKRSRDLWTTGEFAMRVLKHLCSANVRIIDRRPSCVNYVVPGTTTIEPSVDNGWTQTASTDLHKTLVKMSGYDRRSENKAQGNMTRRCFYIGGSMGSGKSKGLREYAAEMLTRGVFTNVLYISPR